MSEVPIGAVAEEVARRGGVVRTRDLLAAGIHRRDLYAARDRGEIVELARGVYGSSDHVVTEPDLVAVATRIPKGVLCCVTALHVHGLTLEIPRAVHLAVPAGTRPPRLRYPPIEVYVVSPASFAAGVEERAIDGVKVRLTTPAKSVADMFKFRRRVGFEAALDALKQALRERAATPGEIDAMAKVCRVQAIVRPYLEALA